jgi:hypothetical protein
MPSTRVKGVHTREKTKISSITNNLVSACLETLCKLGWSAKSGPQPFISY